jgi:hypothetical protein
MSADSLKDAKRSSGLDHALNPSPTGFITRRHTDTQIKHFIASHTRTRAVEEPDRNVAAGPPNTCESVRILALDGGRVPDPETQRTSRAESIVAAVHGFCFWRPPVPA